MDGQRLWYRYSISGTITLNISILFDINEVYQKLQGFVYIWMNCCRNQRVSGDSTLSERSGMCQYPGLLQMYLSSRLDRNQLWNRYVQTKQNWLLCRYEWNLFNWFISIIYMYISFSFLLSSFICSARVLCLTCFSLMSVNVKTF